MKQPETALPANAPGASEVGVGGGTPQANVAGDAGTNGVTENAARVSLGLGENQKIKFAIYSSLENLSVRGWKVTDSHIILFGKTR